MHDFREFETQLGQHDLASLVAVAYHDPQGLERTTRRFLDRFRSEPTPEEHAAERVRVTALVAALDEAAGRLTPIDETQG